MVPNMHWSNCTGTSETLAEIPKDDRDFCEDGQILPQVAEGAHGVSALGGFKTRWNSSLGDLSQMTIIWAGIWTILFSAAPSNFNYSDSGSTANTSR